MTRFSNYDVHQSYDVYTFHNKSTMYWPTNNCSKPLTLSTVTALMMNLVSLPITDIDKRQRVICDGFEIIHSGNADVRIRVDDVEGVANESKGKILKPGESWSPPYRVHQHFTFYTSSNVSQMLYLTVGGYV